MREVEPIGRRDKPTTDQRERAMEIARPLTPKSERRYEGRIAPVSIPSLGKCVKGRKCVRREGHDGECYPKD